jgi:U4/U6 small nuclear ribonucleoprotein PRP3
MAAITAGRTASNNMPLSASAMSISRVGPTIPPVMSDDLARRVAEAKRKVAEVQNRAVVKDNPYLVSYDLFIYHVPFL